MNGVPDLVLVLVTPTGPGSGGGTQQVLRRMIPRWVQAGHRVTLLTHPVDERWDDLPEHVELVPLPAPSPRAMHSSRHLLASARAAVGIARAIRRTARSRRAAVILPFLPGSAVLALIATWGLGSRVVPCERNDPTRQRLHPLIETARRILYRRASAVTVNTAAARDAFVQLLGGRVPVHLVANPLPDWPAPDPAEPREDLIVSVGRLVPQKRHSDVIRAFAHVAPDHPSWRLRIVGEGPDRPHLEQLVADLALEGRVDLPGHTDDVRAVLVRARTLVLASEFEGTPNVLLEGLLAGLDAVVSDAVPPLPEPLQPGRPLARFPVGDVDTLADILKSGILVQQSLHRLSRIGLRGVDRYETSVHNSFAPCFSPNLPTAARRSIRGFFHQP